MWAGVGWGHVRVDRWLGLGANMMNGSHHWFDLTQIGLIRLKWIGLWFIAVGSVGSIFSVDGWTMSRASRNS